jgi:translation elongation factor EF-1alpha
MEEKKIGEITHYFGNISVGIIKLDSSLKVGDTIHIRGAHDDITQSVDSMQIEHDPVESADKGDEVGIKVIDKVHPNDEVYMVID